MVANITTQTSEADSATASSTLTCCAAIAIQHKTLSSQTEPLYSLNTELLHTH